jgi:hypothetical protein
MSWIASPMTAYAAVAVALAVTIYLFLNLKHEMARAQGRWRREQSDLVEALSTCRAELDRIQVSRNAEKSATLQLAPVAIHAPEPAADDDSMSMDLTKRSQALKLHRQGRQPEEIATALHVPKNEVDLLLKVHQAVLSQFRLERKL